MFQPRRLGYGYSRENDCYKENGADRRKQLAQDTSEVIITAINNYTLRISRCIATARERIPGSIGNYVTGVSECRQQRGDLKDNGYIMIKGLLVIKNSYKT
ncbi:MULTISPECIES: hypothetical protein [Photorhabdus]|uniref:Transposase n=1 Tax=Photorhabdus bodei TaxID=2029681 RepID=A0AAW6BL78_9GAMM|nr:MULTISPECIES: hypothetical protein [Photorhabdus]MCC8372935.1 hypothetical protein [Photorhabdus bodei]MCC8462956.1 hypothetical protein [Photorhabdus bodei]MCT8351181.1 hypothetical protein [Photorhabdus kayaii]MDB6368053.1 hypothetical protein [Photorhabdus bodei]MDB6372342.1 hypothetical protein [Photorhabdus bodei]